VSSPQPQFAQAPVVNWLSRKAQQERHKVVLLLPCLAWEANDNVIAMAISVGKKKPTKKHPNFLTVSAEQVLLLASTSLFLFLTRFTTSKPPAKAIGCTLRCSGECVDTIENYTMLIHSWAKLGCKKIQRQFFTQDSILRISLVCGFCACFFFFSF